LGYPKHNASKYDILAVINGREGLIHYFDGSGQDKPLGEIVEMVTGRATPRPVEAITQQ
jgi:hypothetical protein